MDPEGRGDGEQLRGVEGGETVVKLHYVRKKSIFNKRREGGRERERDLTCVPSHLGFSQFQM